MSAAFHLLPLELKQAFCYTRSHYLERASASDFKEAAASRFGHRDVVVFNHFLVQFFKTFLTFQVSLDQNNLTSCQKYHKFLLFSIFADD